MTKPLTDEIAQIMAMSDDEIMALARDEGIDDEQIAAMRQQFDVIARLARQRDIARHHLGESWMRNARVSREHAALVNKVDHLRDLVERLMEALRRPVGWPTTEAAMLEHARRAGATLEALKTLEARGDEVLLTVSKHETHAYVMEPGRERYEYGVDAPTWPDALIALAKEIQQ